MELTVEELEQRVIGLTSLPTLPSVLLNVSKMTEDAESSAAQVAEAISTDQALSAKVLRLVNSPLYGFPGRISSVTHAVVLLGFNVVKGLVLGTTVFEAMGRQHKGLWEHSLACALVSRHLACEADLPEPEEMMIAGLLHDLGKVALSFLFPDEYESACAAAKDRRIHIGEVECEVFRADHAQVGSWVAREWYFPARLTDIIACHHLPDLAKEGGDATAIVHVADVFARALGSGSPGDPVPPPLDHGAVERLGIPCDRLPSIFEEVEAEFAGGASFQGST